MKNIKTMNKRGDIAITLLVIMIITLCTLALFSFLYTEQVRKKADKLAFFSLLQEVYNVAESVGYSGNYEDYQKKGYNFVEIANIKTQQINYGLKKDFSERGLKIEYNFEK